MGIMKLVDVHAHLEHSRFGGDLDFVIGRFEKAGGEFVVQSGVDAVTNAKALEIAGKYDCVKVSFGLYPVDALLKEMGKGQWSGEAIVRDVKKELVWIEEHADECVAIGEVGLDYNFEISEAGKEKQKKVFGDVVDLAKRIGKPLVVHSRKAEEDAVEILEEKGVDKVVMHCFNGRKGLIKRGVENGWFFSVPPVIVRLDHFKMLVEMVPLEQLLTETDAPYLSAVVGERNEPANVAVTIKEIARIKGLSVEEVSEKIYENTKGLFLG